MTADAGPRISVVETFRELTDALGAPSAGGAVILIGGADALAPEQEERLRELFTALAEALESAGTAVVDGGTESGIMRSIGRARATRGGTFRLVGVAPRGKVDAAVGGDGATASLAADHPELLLVPGSEFGDESTWLFAAADHLSGGLAPAIVVNGGQLTVDEATARLRRGASVLAVAGTGRAADFLLGRSPDGSFDPADPDVLASSRLTSVAADTTPADWAKIIATTVAEGRAG